MPSHFAVQLARPLLAHLLAVAPVLGTWHAPSRASLGGLSLLGWTLAVHLACALVPERRVERSRVQAALATLAFSLPALALGLGLDLQAGFRPSALLALAGTGALSLALVGAAAPESQREERAVLASGALFVLLPALLAVALALCGLEPDGARWLAASPLASALRATVRAADVNSLALAPLGAAAVLAVAWSVGRREGARA